MVKASKKGQKTSNFDIFWRLITLCNTMYLIRLRTLIRATTELSGKAIMMSYTASWLSAYCQLHKHKCLFIILNPRAKVLPHCQLLKLGKYRNPTPGISSVHSTEGSVSGVSHWPHPVTDLWIRTSKPAATQTAQVQNRLWVNLTAKHTTPLVHCKWPGHCNWVELQSVL